MSKKAQIGEDFTEYTLSFDDFGERSIQIDSNMAIAPNAALRLNYYTEDLENHRDFYYGDNSGINPTFTYELMIKLQSIFHMKILIMNVSLIEVFLLIGGNPVEDHLLE